MTVFQRLGATLLAALVGLTVAGGAHAIDLVASTRADVYDANNKFVGTLDPRSGSGPIVTLQYGRKIIDARVSPAGFRSTTDIYWTSTGCTGTPYGGSIESIYFGLQPALGPDGTLYVPIDTRDEIVALSRYRGSDGDCSDIPAPEVQTYNRLRSLFNVNDYFTPPFRVQIRGSVVQPQ